MKIIEETGILGPSDRNEIRCTSFVLNIEIPSASNAPKTFFSRILYPLISDYVLGVALNECTLWSSLCTKKGQDQDAASNNQSCSRANVILQQDIAE